jgi:hypothetical protein
MTTTLSDTTVHAYLRGDELVLEDFVERDPDVVAFVREADGAEAAAHRCLEMGARALRLAGATLDAELVEHRFDTMTTQLGHSLAAFAHDIDETAEKLLGEETGALRSALERWLEGVTTTLDATFDETSKRSAIAKLETVLEKARKEQVTAVRALLDPENDESPLAGWRREIVKTIERQGEGLERAIDQLREQLAIDGAVKVERELGTQKGRSFEHVVLDEVSEIVRHLEDTVEHTGDLAGSTGGKVGDLVVTVDPNVTPRSTARYVIEVKDRTLSQNAALAELDEAIANRNAGAGILVFARQAECPVRSPFQWFDSKALVVLDKDSLDPHALRLACLWARWIVTRDADTETDSVDQVRVAALLDDARCSLKTTAAIRGSHTKAKKAIDDAGRQLGEMVDGLTEALDALESEMVGVAD